MKLALKEELEGLADVNRKEGRVLYLPEPLEMPEETERGPVEVGKHSHKEIMPQTFG